MTISTFKWEVLPSSRQLETRPAGVAAREHVLRLLKIHDRVVLDFGGKSVTPSFIDELVGGLLIELGESIFKEKISFVRVADSLAPLLRHVILKRRFDQKQSAA